MKLLYIRENGVQVVIHDSFLDAMTDHDRNEIKDSSEECLLNFNGHEEAGYKISAIAYEKVMDSFRNLESSRMTHCLNAQAMLTKYYFQSPNRHFYQKLSQINDERSIGYQRRLWFSSPSIYKYLIPSRYREEVLGDLHELALEMIRKSIPPWKIRLVLTFHKVCILISLSRLRISDWGRHRSKHKKTT